MATISRTSLPCILKIVKLSPFVFLTTSALGNIALNSLKLEKLVLLTILNHELSDVLAVGYWCKKSSIGFLEMMCMSIPCLFGNDESFFV
jgi:hypothetical protein